MTNSVKVQPNAPSYILLGKTQIKAKKYKEAVESLENALEFMVNDILFIILLVLGGL